MSMLCNPMRPLYRLTGRNGAAVHRLPNRYHVPRSMLRRNVLIFHSAALGDFVLTWPFAVALARIYAQSRIIYVTHREKGLLAERVLRLESTDAEGGWHHLYADGGDPPERAGRLLAGAHAIYTFGTAPPAWLANVRRLNAAANLVVLDGSADGPGHKSDQLLEELAPHRPEAEATRQILRSVADRGIGFNRPPGTHVVIHPGAGSPDKCWPAECYMELAARLTAAGSAVRFVIGEVERERWSAEALRELASAAEVRQPTTLLDLLGEVSLATQFIGNDSGPGHLAAILGVPTLTLFGPTDPARWHPLGPSVRHLRRQPISSLTVDDVLAEL
jgi:heptosyltransferase-3